MAPVVLVGGLGASGDERGRETEEGEGMQRVREKREGVGEARGVVRASLGRPGRKQEVAEQGGGGARGGVAVSVLLAGRKTTGEGGGGGLGRWGSWARKVGAR